jgi:hypothetical protein
VDSEQSLAQGRKGWKFKRLSTGGALGHEARYYEMTRLSDKVLVYAVLWRHANVKASLLVSGFATLSPQLAMRLARKQEAKIAGS